MAYLKELVEPMCADCHYRTAKYELFNRQNYPIRKVCGPCSKKALASLKAMEIPS